MTALREPARAARPTPVRRPRRFPSLAGAARESRIVFWLTLAAIAITASIMVFPNVIPINALVVPLLLGSLLLGPRQLPWFVVFVMVGLMLALTRQSVIQIRTVIAVAIVFLLSFIILLTSFRRSRLGVAGVLGESMLVDLRDRILGQGGIPELPHGWYAESALRSAGGTPFAGDFIVATTSPGGERLEVVVVDVSGKGEQAGTRALLLSGAFGGLLTALDPAHFLPSANNYLLRQQWEEGFATAVHLSLQLDTGAFEVRTAGHPPAIQLAAGSGRWAVLETEGPILGLIEGADFPCVRGELRRGDALLLYTDGMVETRRRDIGLGIDRMVGQAERLLRGEFDGGAARLVEALGSQNDDRALLLVHRR
ncbi:PP2C family protein-serine/threonine phosphatase [Nocardioides sp. LS1]|uniref:PP2C family protein-serine/threonine phosphatase n=1 Tax=Nocardioides sp. LS1 TaxID=1027620 RepID=UPI000F61CAA6|nr:PP2C family protein-serine/threonine phosphatase [Nocardioides sp. LS1]GCD90858.1 membrane protein [Nocardioides sp. LS1]